MTKLERGVLAMTAWAVYAPQWKGDFVGLNLGGWIGLAFLWWFWEYGGKR
jgi:hypothetical protein